MSDELEEIVDNISEPSFWIRILLMIAFAIASYIIILPLVLVLTIAQALFTLITGQSNANLRYFSATLALYIPQIIEYLTYLSELRPYPFSDLPEVEDDSLPKESKPKSAKKQKSKQPDASVKSEASASATVAAEKKPAAAKKKAVKKKSAKKKAAKKAPKTIETPEADTKSEGASDL